MFKFQNIFKLEYSLYLQTFTIIQFPDLVISYGEDMHGNQEHGKQNFIVQMLGVWLL